MPRVSRKRLTALVATGAGVAAIVAVLVLFTGGLRGAGAGAPDPLSAVRHLAAAAVAEDPAAVLATIDPREADAVESLYENVRSRVRRTGAVRPDGGLAGTELALDDLRLEREDLGEGVAKVRIVSGTLRARLQAAQVPAAAGLHDASGRVDLGDVLGPRDAGLFVIARERDGRWYVSPALTGLQYLVELEDLPEADFSLLADEAVDDRSRAPENGEELLRRAAGAAGTKDVGRAVELLAPDEADLLRPYRSALEELVSRTGGSVSADVASAHVEEHPLGGDLVRLDVANLQAAASVQSDDTYDGGQIGVTGLCVSVDGEAVGCGDAVRRAFGIDRYFLVAQRDDQGGLRISPVGTVVGYGRALVDHLGSDGLIRMLGLVPDDGPQLRAGLPASGQLGDAGLAVLRYRADGSQYLAVTSDRLVDVVGPDGTRPPEVACPASSNVFRLPARGTYRIALATGAYRSAEYHVTAAPVEPRRVGTTGSISGVVPRGGGVVAFRIPYSPALGQAIEFHSSDAVQSDMSGPLPLDAGWCPAWGVVGLGTLLYPGPTEPQDSEIGDGGGTWQSLEPFYEAGDYLLTITGAPGTRFSGTLTPRDDS